MDNFVEDNDNPMGHTNVEALIAINTSNKEASTMAKKKGNANSKSQHKTSSSSNKKNNFH